MHVAYQGLGDEAGAEGATVAVESWVSVSAERQKCAGEARYRAAELPDGDIRERMFLAWARGGGATNSRFRIQGSKFKVLQDSDDEQGVLGCQNPSQPGARQGELPRAARERVARDSHLGVPVDGEEAGTYHA